VGYEQAHSKEKALIGRQAAASATLIWPADLNDERLEQLSGLFAG